MLTLSPPCEALTQDLPPSKQPSLVYFPRAVLIFSHEITGHEKQTEGVIRTRGLLKASFAGVPAEDWNGKKPCVACFTAIFASSAACGP